MPVCAHLVLDELLRQLDVVAHAVGRRNHTGHEGISLLRGQSLLDQVVLTTQTSQVRGQHRLT